MLYMYLKSFKVLTCIITVISDYCSPVSNNSCCFVFSPCFSVARMWTLFPHAPAVGPMNRRMLCDYRDVM